MKACKDVSNLSVKAGVILLFFYSVSSWKSSEFYRYHSEDEAFSPRFSRIESQQLCHFRGGKCPVLEKKIIKKLAAAGSTLNPSPLQIFGSAKEAGTTRRKVNSSRGTTVIRRYVR